MNSLQEPSGFRQGSRRHPSAGWAPASMFSLHFPRSVFDYTFFDDLMPIKVQLLPAAENYRSRLQSPRIHGYPAETAFCPVGTGIRYANCFRPYPYGSTTQTGYWGEKRCRDKHAAHPAINRAVSGTRPGVWPTGPRPPATGMWTSCAAHPSPPSCWVTG